MKLKIQVLLILLITLLINPLLANPSKTNENNLENELGIDLTKTYSSQEVIELCNIILDEADISIKKAYEEGYKQATLELKPDLEYYKLISESKTELTIQQYITAASIGLGIGFIGGGITGFCIKLPTSR